MTEFFKFIEKAVRSHWEFYGEAYAIRCTFWKDGSGGRVKKRCQENEASHKRHSESTAEYLVMLMLMTLGEWTWLLSLKEDIATWQGKCFVNFFVCGSLKLLCSCYIYFFLGEFNKCIQCIWIISTQHYLSNRKFWMIIYKQEI